MIIVICGAPKSGKTTLAAHIASKYRAPIINYMDETHHVARQLGWDGQHNPRGEQLLRTIIQAGHAYDPRIWINRLMDAINRFIPRRFVIIDGLETYEELCTLRIEYSMAVQSIFLIRVAWQQSDLKPYNCDYVISNNKSLDAFYKEVDAIIGKL